ncbi:MAG: hypothetical protein KJ852_01305 [Gammaproteobacteria bacterium]|nr:hypothetical protein [Gammaproteobacteria bacterium]MBU0788189.1 hypothetical protein [Gammaproteobacteria bacterium]MBU0815314.1 hypothetical protein [Gammaproteobacteria bacterium]MBU1785578.1 hypothetical protein [Gammaproteobacteria bacterium]
MITLRSHAFAWRVFALNEVTLAEDALEARIRAFKDELSTDLPALRFLLASTLTFSFKPGDKTIQVIANLVEAPQKNLLLTTRHDGSGDLYLQEVARVMKEQANLREAYAWTFYSQEHPTDDPRIVELRQRARRDGRNGQLHIHSGQGGELFDTGSMPRILPQCWPHEAMVRVLALSSTWIDILFIDELVDAETGRLVFWIGDKFRIDRHEFSRDPVTTEVIAKAMDSASEISLQVVIEYRWTDGLPSRLTLIERPNTAVAG